MTATTRTASPARTVRPPPVAGRIEPAGTVVLVMLTVATAVGMCRLFPDWQYMRPLLAVVIGVHAAAAVLRFARVPVWLALPIVAAVAVELLALVYYRSSTRLLLPTGDTIQFIRSDLRLVWEQFPTAVAPVPSAGSFAMACAALLAAAATLADTFAFRAFGRAEAIVPTGVVFVFTAALGTDRNRVAVSALWIGTAILVIAILRFEHDRDESAWMGSRRRSLASVVPAALTCACIAALAAVVVAPRLPGAKADALFDARNRGGDVTQVLNPLVDIRSRLINRANVEVFTVRSPTAAYWRVISLEEFDGTQWQPIANEPLRSADGQLATTGAGESIDQVITVKRLGGKLIPAAYAPVLADTPNLFWADGSQTLVRPDPGIGSGDVFRIRSVKNDPPADELRAATVANAPDARLYDLPGSFPDEVRQTAAAVTAAGTNPYDRMLLLQAWFRTNFAYDLSVQAGHGDNAILNFLRIRRGYCEQFSATFAAMARSLGLASRVAIGFTPGEQRDDGLYHVYDRQAHAWPEVWFDGYGWITFEPTPGRGEPGSESHTGVGAAQDDSPAVLGDGSGAAPATTAAPAGQVAPIVPNPVQPIPNVAVTTVAPTGSGSSGGETVAVWFVLAILAIAAWVLLMPRALREFESRRHRDPQDRVATAWSRACTMLHLAGSPVVAGSTPLEFAQIASARTGVDAQLVRELARAVTTAAYGPAGADERTASRSEQLTSQISALCRARLPLATRALAKLDPRMARTVG